MAASTTILSGFKRALKLPQGTTEMDVLFGPARGVTMRLDPMRHAPLMFGYYELELIGFIRRYATDAKWIFDVGGADGYDAMIFARLGSADVATFEPWDVKVASMSHNLSLNPRLAERIHVYPEPLGAPASGDATVDEMAALLGKPDFIKIDVNGGETDVLLGAERTLREHRPHLIIETHSPELERACGDLLCRAGYSPRIKHNRRVLAEHRPSPHCRWLTAVGGF